MAEQNSIDNNSNNNNNDKSVETPIERRQRLMKQFHLPTERWEEIRLKRRIRLREEEEKRRQEGSYDGDKEGDEEAYKPFFRNITKCLVKPPCGHEAWCRYRDSLATEKAAAANSAYHEQEVLEGGHETTSTQKENNNSGETPIKRGQRLKRKFVLTSERWEEIRREDMIRRREEKEKRRQEGKEDSNDDENEDDEEFKAYTANMTKCLVKPRLGHEAWWRYMDYLSTKRAAAATSAYHDDEALGPNKKLKVNEQEALEGGHEMSTQKDN